MSSSRARRIRGSIVPRLGLFPKYAMALMALVSAALVASGSLEMALVYRSTLEATQELQRSEVRTAAMRIEQYLEGIRAQVFEVSTLPWDTGMLDLNDRREEFHRLMKLVPAISQVRTVDFEGRERMKVSRVELDEVNALASVGAREDVREAKAKGVYFSPAYFKSGTEPYMTIAVRESEPAWSVTLAEINLKFVSDVVAQLPIERGGRVYVVDAANHLLAHPNLRLVLRNTDLSAYEPLKRIRAELRAGASGYVSMTDVRGLEGGEAMLSAGYIPTVGLLVVMEQSRDVVLAPVYAALTRTAMLWVAGLAAALLVSWFLARRLADPILTVRRGAEKIAHGDLSTRIDVKTGDEVEALAREFNRMGDQLQEYTSGLERKVAEKTGELERANRHKSEFLANMSHELRTPLNAIIGFSEVLKERMFGSLNAKQSEYVHDIHGSGQHLLSLINDILDLAKVEAGRMELEVREFDVDRAIGNCATLIRERANRGGLAFTLVVDPGLGAWVGDERRFKQVVLNLLSNAVKFTPPGGAVALRARVQAGWLVVSVADTGIGIDASDQEAIFEEFHQLSDSSSAKNEGTGLGLALSRRMMALHGGSLAVESERGRGSTFTARFPPRKEKDSHG